MWAEWTTNAVEAVVIVPIVVAADEEKLVAVLFVAGAADGEANADVAVVVADAGVVIVRMQLDPWLQIDRFSGANGSPAQ